MIRENTHSPEDCRALSEVLGRIGDRWTILVVGLLSMQPMHFNEIRRMLDGITQRMLTLTLRALERDGLVVRTSLATKVPSVTYGLTARGTSLLVPLMALAEWGWQHRLDIGQSRESYDKAHASKG